MSSEDVFDVTEDLFPSFDATFNTHDGSVNLNITMEEDTSIYNIYNSLEVKFQTLSEISLNDVENMFFKSEMPQLQHIIERIITTINKKMENCNVVENNVLMEVKDLLQIFINSLQLFCVAVNHICEKISILCVQTLPISICEILLVTFQHCKECDNIYGVYFNLLSEVLTSLFKKAIEVENHFLSLFKSNLIFNLRDEKEVTFLLNIMESLAYIGEIHSTLDIQTVSELWKTYIYIMQTYSEYLKPRLDLSCPLRFLSSEIGNGLESIVKMDSEADFKSTEKQLKICSFNLKVIIKLCSSSNNLKECYKYLFNLLLTLHRYSTPYLLYEKCSPKLIDSAQVYVSVGAEPLLVQLISDQQFIEHYFQNIPLLIDNDEERMSAILLTVTIIKKLINSSDDIKDLWIQETNIPSNIISVIFIFIEKCHIELSVDIPISPPKLPDDQSDRGCTLYEYILLYLSTLAISLKATQFYDLEKVLLQSVLSQNDWKAMFATDMWCIIARYGSVDLCQNQLNVLIDIFDNIKNCEHQIEVINISNLMNRLYQLLTNKCKTELQKKRPVLSNVKLWTVLGLDNYPNSSIYSKIYQNATDKIATFLNSNKLTDFYEMCDLLGLISSLPTIEGCVGDMNFVSTFSKLWTLSTNSELCESTWFQQFTLLRCKVTASLIKCFSNSDLNKILLKLKKLLNSNDEINLSIIAILMSLGTQLIENTAEQGEILSSVTYLFKNVLNTANPVVKQKAYEAFCHFAHNTRHENVLPNIVSDDCALQTDVMDYLQQTVHDTDTLSQREYLGAQSKATFLHRCHQRVQVVGPKQKKIKLATEKNSTSVVNSVLEDLRQSCSRVIKCWEKEEFTVEQKEELSTIVTTLQTLL